MSHDLKSTLKEVKGLHEEKKGRCSMLMIEGSVGRAVFEASQNSMVDEGVILSKAAGIVRNNLFSQDQSFDGNLASDPKSLLPIHLLRLLALIFEGCKNFDKISAQLRT